MNTHSLERSLNVAGVSIGLVGSFLLSVEAIRVARVARGAESVKMIADRLTDQSGGDPLPLTWPFALVCAAFCAISWSWARVLVIWTITPAAFVILFLSYRFLRWSAQHSADGFAAVVGFGLTFLGSALQLIALLCA